MRHKPTEIITVLLQFILVAGVWAQTAWFVYKSKILARNKHTRNELRRLTKDNRDLRNALELYRPPGHAPGPHHFMAPNVEWRDYASPELRSRRSHEHGADGAADEKVIEAVEPGEMV